MVALSLRTILWLFGIGFIIPGLSEGPWMLVVGLVLLTCVLIGDIVKIFLNIFGSPERLELNNNILTIKHRLRNSNSIDVNEVTRIAEASWVKIIASYDRKIIYSNKKLILYLGEVEFVGLNDFITALLKANPRCQVDEYLL
jgi:hypothetical protein